MSHLTHYLSTNLFVDPIFGVDAVAQRGAVHRAYATIAAALAAALPGDSIVLAAGTYPEGIVMPDKSRISIVGQGTDNTFITPPVGTDAFNWTPAIVGMNYLSLQDLTLRPSGTGRGLAFSGSLLPGGPPAPEFLYDSANPKTSGAFLSRVNIEKTGTGDVAFVFRAGNLFVDSCIWTTASGAAPAGRVKLEQPGLFVFTDSLLTKNDFPTSLAEFDYAYVDDLIPPDTNTPAGGRQAVVLVSSRIQGDIILRGAPLFLMDSDSFCDVQVRGQDLAFFDVGPATKHGPLIFLDGTIGSPISQGAPLFGDVDFGTIVARNLPALIPAFSFAFKLDFLGARIYGTVTLVASGAVRWPVSARGTQFETNAALGDAVSIATLIDLDARGAMWRTQSVFVAVGAGTLDRSAWAISGSALPAPPATLAVPIVPPFPAGATYIASPASRVVGAVVNPTAYAAGAVTLAASAAGLADTHLRRF